MITISEYLIKRLAEVGCTDIFGVPGDYNLPFFDVLSASDSKWIGCANELNAGYAADGYARKRGFGAILTTYGVGELSAINAIAGSFTENVPVLKIVGAPATALVARGAIVHHSLAQGQFDTFENCFKNVTVYAATVTRENAAFHIDAAIEKAFAEKRPAYISIPVDLFSAEIAEPECPLVLDWTPGSTDVSSIVELLAKAERPVIFPGFALKRYAGLVAKVEALVDKLNLPFASFLMSKGVLNEAHPNNLGIYFHNAGSDTAQQYIENSDCVIFLGEKISDGPSNKFQAKIPYDKTVVVTSEDFNLPAVVDALLELDLHFDAEFTHVEAAPIKTEFSDAPLTVEGFQKMVYDFTRAGDNLSLETGTTSFGLSVDPQRAGVNYSMQIIWGAIGYSLPATLGGAIAAPDERHLLIIGDGSFQLTFNDLGLITRQGLKPIIFVVDNDGYTIERAIHGPEEEFNDIARWNYAAIPAALGVAADVHEATSEAELAKVLVDVSAAADRAHFVVVKTDKFDYPNTLKRFTGK
ncbi:MAG: hypothetical protein LBN08_00255 [Lactobacillales bacterium]|jgi:indolepyruvate decarboxylase|nr:hypothetical protein [Lactobacillales bacterium]